MARNAGDSQTGKTAQEEPGSADALMAPPDFLLRKLADSAAGQPQTKEISREVIRQKIMRLERRMDALTAEIILQRQVVAEQVTPVIQYLERTILELQTKGPVVARFYNRLAVVPRFKRKLARARGVLADAAADFLQEHARSEDEKRRLEREIAALPEARG